MSIAGPPSDLITREGYERLQAELDHLVTTRRPELERWLRDAREGGTDPGDNSDLGDALDERALLERRIAELEHRLETAEMVVPPSDGTAGFGASVRLRLPGGRAVSYVLVGALEADPAQGRVSIASPVGQALLGRVAGDEVEVETPGGARRFEVLAVEYPPEAVAA